MIRKIITVLLLLTYIFILAILFVKNNKKVEYCGEVTSMYRTDAGYRVSQESHIVFFCDSLNRKVDAKVSNNTYANTVVGQSLCLKLSNNDLER